MTDRFVGFLRSTFDTAWKALVGAGSVALAALFIALVIRSCDSGDATIGEVRSNLLGEGYEVSLFRELSLHPPEKSYLLALRRTADPLAADEVRIYDQRLSDDTVSRKLIFRPTIDHPARPPGVPLGFTLEVSAVRDFDRDGLREVVGSYILADVNSTQRLPVTIAWDEAEKRYHLEPVLSDRFPIANLTKAMSNLPGGPELYSKLYGVHDDADGRELVSYSVQNVGVVLDRDDAYLVGTLPVSSPYGRRQELQVSAWYLTFEEGRPQATLTCFMGEPKGFRLPARVSEYLLVSASLATNPGKAARSAFEAALRQGRRARRVDGMSALYLGSSSPGVGCNFGE
jgi:hypothetical protein